jgi:putative transposase
MRSADDVREKLKYMHENPVKRGLVACPDEWPWSSARWYSGSREGELEIDPMGL